MSRMFGLMIAVILLLSIGGCGPAPMSISITLDKTFLDAYGNRPIEVNVVALKNPEGGVLEKASMTQYWGTHESKRPFTLAVTLDAKTPEKTILATDALWDTWLKGAACDNPPQLFLLVQLPGSWDVSKDQDGSLDPRRKIISTCGKRGFLDPPPSAHLVIGKDRIWLQ